MVQERRRRCPLRRLPLKALGEEVRQVNGQPVNLDVRGPHRDPGRDRVQQSQRRVVHGPRRVACVHLGDDAGKGPHVLLRWVVACLAFDHLRRKHLCVVAAQRHGLLACGACVGVGRVGEIAQLDDPLVLRHHHAAHGQASVRDALAVQPRKRLQHLPRVRPHHGVRQTLHRTHQPLKRPTRHVLQHHVVRERPALLHCGRGRILREEGRKHTDDVLVLVLAQQRHFLQRLLVRGLLLHQVGHRRARHLHRHHLSRRPQVRLVRQPRRSLLGRGGPCAPALPGHPRHDARRDAHHLRRVGARQLRQLLLPARRLVPRLLLPPAAPVLRRQRRRRRRWHARVRVLEKPQRAQQPRGRRPLAAVAAEACLEERQEVCGHVVCGEARRQRRVLLHLHQQRHRVEVRGPRWLPRQHLDAGAADGPDVGLHRVVPLVLAALAGVHQHHLRRHPVRCADKRRRGAGTPPVPLAGGAEVGHLRTPGVEADEDVLALEVAVCEAGLVEVRDAAEDVACVHGAHGGWEAVRLEAREEVRERPAADVLEEEVERRLIGRQVRREVPHDVRVLQRLHHVQLLVEGLDRSCRHRRVRRRRGRRRTRRHPHVLHRAPPAVRDQRRFHGAEGAAAQIPQRQDGRVVDGETDTAGAHARATAAAAAGAATTSAGTAARGAGSRLEVAALGDEGCGAAGVDRAARVAEDKAADAAVVAAEQEGEADHTVVADGCVLVGLPDGCLRLHGRDADGVRLEAVEVRAVGTDADSASPDALVDRPSAGTDGCLRSIHHVQHHFADPRGWGGERRGRGGAYTRFPHPLPSLPFPERPRSMKYRYCSF
eukprot:Rhum_TRINITY_DN8932_c0_g1::Rhum_TRINITY_DN8932_c0_g1_i1::g.30470::m.30470